MEREVATTNGMKNDWKTVFMDICSATNRRTFYGTLQRAVPCGHSAPTLRTSGDLTAQLLLTLVSNSLPFDYLLRKRVGGLHLTWNFLSESAAPRASALKPALLAAASLCLTHERFAPAWGRLIADSALDMPAGPWRSHWSLSRHARLRDRAIADAIAAHAFGLDVEDFHLLITGCDYPVDTLRQRGFSQSLDPKGFWRVQKGEDPELRHPILAFLAFKDLQIQGLEAFMMQNDGRGWLIPREVTLASHGLGHGARSKEAQPVAERLGPRFFPWQEAQSEDESWEECDLHARLIQHIESRHAADDSEVTEVSRVAEPAADYPDLFGEPSE